MEAAGVLKELVDRVVELKKQQAPTDEACRAGTMALLRLRQQYREAALGSEAVRERAAAAKSQLDRFVLQVHNLLYEKQFYEKEVASCTNFRSAYSDETINLIPEAAYLSTAAGAAAAAEAGGDAHALALARLNHELASRKALTAELATAQAARAREAARAAKQKAQLESLQAALRGLEQAGRPLAGALGPRAELRAAMQKAALLPAPLWVIYSQFRAAADALGQPVDVDIDGTAEDATHAAANQAAPSGGRAARGGGGGAAGGAPPSKRRKEGSAQPEEGVYRVRAGGAREGRWLGA